MRKKGKKEGVSSFSDLVSYLLATLFKLNVDKIKYINNKKIRYLSLKYPLYIRETQLSFLIDALLCKLSKSYK